MPNDKIFHAGQYEDARIREHWPRCPDSGIFVDVGAGNGITASNTLHFSRSGWRGLLIDADPRQCELLRTNRPGEEIELAAICDHDGMATIYITRHLDHASLLPDLYFDRRIGSIDVPARRLETMLEHHGIGKIDLLSIDVEGSEMTAWRSMDFSRHCPSCVVIEHEHSPGGPIEILREFISLGYSLIDANDSNFVFILKDQI